jgi:hypothetical protein
MGRSERGALPELIPTGPGRRQPAVTGRGQSRDRTGRDRCRIKEAATNIQENTAMKTFATPAPISATVDIVMGDIRFVAADRTDTAVDVRPLDPTRKLDIEAAELVDVVFADGRLRVSHPKLRKAFSTKFGTVTVRVELPTGSDVHGSTAQGDYLVQGRVGSCRLKTAIGGIRVGQAADAQLKTTGGKVTVDHVTGPADVGANGEIRIGRVDGDAVVKNLGGDVTVDAAAAAITAKTTTGDIRIGEIGTGTGTVDVYAAIGRLDVGVPEGTGVRLDARATTGRVRSDLESPAQADRIVKVRARCNGGDITVHRVGRDAEHGAARLSA